MKRALCGTAVALALVCAPDARPVASIGDAARCMNIDDRLGSLRAGLHADFLVLTNNPLEDTRHLRTLESVWIAGIRARE